MRVPRRRRGLQSLQLIRSLLALHPGLPAPARRPGCPPPRHTPSPIRMCMQATCLSATCRPHRSPVHPPPRPACHTLTAPTRMSESLARGALTRRLMGTQTRTTTTGQPWTGQRPGARSAAPLPLLPPVPLPVSPCSSSPPWCGTPRPMPMRPLRLPSWMRSPPAPQPRRSCSQGQELSWGQGRNVPAPPVL